MNSGGRMTPSHDGRLHWDEHRVRSYLRDGDKRVAWVHEFPGGGAKFGIFDTHGPEYMRATLEEAKAAAEAAVKAGWT